GHGGAGAEGGPSGHGGAGAKGGPPPRGSTASAAPTRAPESSASPPPSATGAAPLPTRGNLDLAGFLALPDAALPDQAPWRVAQLHVSRLPAALGVETAWDSVVYGAESLGYVTSTHQAGTYGGPGVLTWYQPLLGDPLAARRALLDEPWETARDLVLDDLGASHPDLLDVVERLDVWHWGHGTVRPVPGLHAPGRLDALHAPHPRVHLAHTDLSGLSLFEEASFQGIRAAEAVLTLFGRPADTWT
ncbi:MAG: hypothetical protein Q8P41_02250, partial [Pseudomonadota bacterium]|nr:hypothetical protein [Pseudomonadota bacterium]